MRGFKPYLNLLLLILLVCNKDKLLFYQVSLIESDGLSSPFKLSVDDGDDGEIKMVLVMTAMRMVIIMVVMMMVLVKLVMIVF